MVIAYSVVKTCGDLYQIFYISIEIYKCTDTTGLNIHHLYMVIICMDEHTLIIL